MAIRTFEDAEDFDEADDMLDRQALAGQATIRRSFSGRQRMMFTGLFWRLSQCMALLNALIPRISLDLRLWVHIRSGLLKEHEVMDGTATGRGADDLAREGMDEQLGLQGVPLFLPAVPLLLFF
nr:hypothetical protein [Deinococcus cavernae]